MADTEPTIDDTEVDEADALEQRQDVRAVGRDDDDVPTEVDPADLAEQQAEVDLDEDEYR